MGGSGLRLVMSRPDAGLHPRSSIGDESGDRDDAERPVLKTYLRRGADGLLRLGLVDRRHAAQLTSSTASRCGSASASVMRQIQNCGVVGRYPREVPVG